MDQQSYRRGVVKQKMILPIEITFEEGSDYNSSLVAKIQGQALTQKELIFATKINEIVDYIKEKENA